MEKFFYFFPKIIEKVLTKWKSRAIIIPETERNRSKIGIRKEKQRSLDEGQREDIQMNRTFENERKNFNTYQNEAYGQDYLLVAILAIIRFFALPRVKTVCQSLTAFAAFFFMLGIVGGVETGALPLYCLFPLLGLSVIGVVGTHRARK